MLQISFWYILSAMFCNGIDFDFLQTLESVLVGATQHQKTIAVGFLDSPFLACSNLLHEVLWLGLIFWLELRRATVALKYYLGL